MANPFQPVAPANNSFLPEDYVARKAESRANILILTLFALVLGAVVSAFLVTNHRWKQLREHQTLVNDQYAAEGMKIEQLKALEGQRAQMMEKAEITAALVEKVPRWALLGDMTLRMPSDMRLDQFVLKSTRIDAPRVVANAPPPPAVKSLTDKVLSKEPAKPERQQVVAPKFDYAVTITGTAMRNNDVADFLASIKSSPVFSDVEMTYIRVAREGAADVRKFEFTAKVQRNVDTKVVASALKNLVDARIAKAAGGMSASADAPEAGASSTKPDTVTAVPGGQE